jgi:hypothetical protein
VTNHPVISVVRTSLIAALEGKLEALVERRRFPFGLIVRELDNGSGETDNAPTVRETESIRKILLFTDREILGLVAKWPPRQLPEGSKRRVRFPVTVPRKEPIHQSVEAPLAGRRALYPGQRNMRPAVWQVRIQEALTSPKSHTTFIWDLRYIKSVYAEVVVEVP